MSAMHMNFTSRSLTQKMDLWVVYPTPTLQDMIQHKDAYDATRQWPVVYMLHGAGGDGFEWVQRADVEAWCCKYGFIAVMPSCQLSFYNDTPDGRNFATYVAWELPNMIEATFHASRQAVSYGCLITTSAQNVVLLTLSWHKVRPSAKKHTMLWPQDCMPCAVGSYHAGYGIALYGSQCLMLPSYD